MLPIRLWDAWTWIMLICVILNVVSLFTGGNIIISLVFGGISAYGFYLNVFK